MGVVEISDGISTRRIRVDDLQGVVRVDCGGDAPTVVVPAGAEVDQGSGRDAADPVNRRRVRR